MINDQLVISLSLSWSTAREKSQKHRKCMLQKYDNCKLSFYLLYSSGWSENWSRGTYKRVSGHSQINRGKGPRPRVERGSKY